MGIPKRSSSTKEGKFNHESSPLLTTSFAPDSFKLSKYPTKKVCKRIARPKPPTPRNKKKTEFIFVSPLPKTPLQTFMRKVFNICCLAFDVLRVSNLIGEANVLMKDQQIDHILKHFELRKTKKIDIIEPDW